MTLSRAFARTTIAVGLTVAMLGAGVPAHAENTGAGDEVEATADLIAQVAPDQGEVVTGQPTGDAVSVTTDTATAEVPIDAEEPVRLTDQDATLSLSLPAEAQVENGKQATDGTVVYEPTTPGGVTVATQILEDASVRVQVVIPDASAPQSYTYDLGLPQGAVATPLEDGSLSFTAADGTWLGGVAAPWAVDATGADVPTTFRVEAGLLIQDVDLSGVVNFPVVADPWLGIALFSKITRDSYQGAWRINATKSLYGNSIHLPTATGQSIMLNEGWKEIASKYPSTVSLNRSFYQQYQCHVAGGYFTIAGPWNLEGFRPPRTTHWSSGVAKHHCNWNTPDGL